VSLEHKVKLSLESLDQMFTKKQIFCPYCNSQFQTNEQLSTHIDKIHNESGVLEGNVGGL
jgi:uncharacterized protein (DUF2225 family)